MPSRRPVASRGNESTESAWGIAVLALALGAGTAAFAVYALRGDGGSSGAGPEQPQLATEETASSVPSLTATASPTARPTEASTRTPSPTPVRETPTDIPMPAQTPPPPPPPPTQAPAAEPGAAPSPEPAETADLTGRWQIVDVVEFGQDAGTTFRFVVTLAQDGTTVRGSGEGLNIEGELEEGMLRATYTRPGGSGVFAWRLTNDGARLEGGFEDHGAQNGGTSTLVRLP